MQVTRLVVGSLSANCYIVAPDDSTEGMVIDPGGNAGRILQAVDELCLDITLIVVTHGHSDHIAALYEVQKRTGAELAVHCADAQYLKGRGTYSMMFGIEYRTPAPPDHLLRNGDMLSVGTLRFDVLHTPGHTPGGICLLGQGCVFTGDTLFYRGIGTTMMPGTSRTQLIDSIQTQLMTLPDETIVYPGHGRQTTIGAERAGNHAIRGRRW